MKNLILTLTVILGVGAVSAPALAAGGGEKAAGGVEIKKLDSIALSLHMGEDEPCGLRRLYLDLALMGEGVSNLGDLSPLIHDRINQHLSGLSVAESREKGFAAQLKIDLKDIISEAVGEDYHIDEVLIQKMLVQ
tara:strand:- start:975 stop:1379 length:405 start_codon:yes stop_codon:yes gene_type:complete